MQIWNHGLVVGVWWVKKQNIHDSVTVITTPFLYLALNSLNIDLLQYPYRDMDISKEVVLHLIHITINTLNAQYHSCRPHASAGPLYSDNSNISRYSEKEKGKIIIYIVCIGNHRVQYTFCTLILKWFLLSWLVLQRRIACLMNQTSMTLQLEQAARNHRPSLPGLSGLEAASQSSISLWTLMLNEVGVRIVSSKCFGCLTLLTGSLLLLLT